MRILVSACLLGENCKYNGGNNRDERVLAFLRGHEVISACPEACLGTPRIPMEIVDGVLINREGENMDAPVRAAVAEILEKIRPMNIGCAVLKSRSPTCGVRQVYDGTFTGTRVDGAGVFARALMDAGYRVLDAEEI